MSRSRHARSAPYAPARLHGRFAPWTAWRGLSEAATAAALAPAALPLNLTTALKAAQVLPFPVEGASAQASAECLRRMARAWIDAPPGRRTLLEPALKGAAGTVWNLIEDAVGAAGRPPAWLEG